MTRDDQKRLLTDICNNVRDALLERSDRWPEEWDGHELRELVYKAHALERTSFMQEPRSKRRRNVDNEWITKNLY